MHPSPLILFGRTEKLLLNIEEGAQLLFGSLLLFCSQFQVQLSILALTLQHDLSYVILLDRVIKLTRDMELRIQQVQGKMITRTMHLENLY